MSLTAKRSTTEKTWLGVGQRSQIAGSGDAGGQGARGPGQFASRILFGAERRAGGVGGRPERVCRQEDALRREMDKLESPENIAALMVPREGDSPLLQRMEDSNLRQLWRLTNILSKVQKGALT